MTGNPWLRRLVLRIAPLAFELDRRCLLGAETRVRRTRAVFRYCRGEGIEVGAAASPSLIPPGARVRYVDKYDYDVIAADPELAAHDPVRPDVVTPAETLAAIESQTQSFVLGFSLFEHLQDPLRGLANFVRVTRPGGFVILSVPDKRHYSPDSRRPVTSFSHVVDDFERGPAGSALEHLREAGTFHHELSGAALEQFIAERLASDGHTHFHVWDAAAFQDFVARGIAYHRLPAEVVEMANYGNETMIVLSVR